MRKWRLAHPYEAAYHILKFHAKARKIPFTITFKYFKRFAKKFRYLIRTGRYAENITIDRRNNLRGYVRGNIQVMTRRKNSEKKMRADAYRIEGGMSWQK